jgi:hypothetical protein
MIDALDVWLQILPGTLMEHFWELGTSGVVIDTNKAC